MKQASQYAHRVRLALDYVKAEYTTYDVNLANKPDWFLAQINIAGTVRSPPFSSSRVRAY